MRWTAESVTPKHPDKLCDIISDSILDACLKQDPKSRVAIETMGGHGVINVCGELTTDAYVDIRELVEKVLGKPYGVQVNIVKQSNEIANGVDTGGAGDQGVMVGYACSDTPELMPKEVMLARDLCQFLFYQYPYDGKTQVTWNSETDEIEAIVASFQNVSKSSLENAVKTWLEGHKTRDTSIYCNPAGDWLIGGFDADTGLTGRKIVIDQYGLRAPVGGGAFSGKDATKVDRSGAYMARKIAVDYLKKYQADEVIVNLAYAIGKTNPVMATALVDGVQTEVMGYDLTPNGIIKFLDLRKAKFADTAKWGHFGRHFKWDDV